MAYADIIRAPHWISLGRDEDYARGIEAFQQHLAKTTHHLKIYKQCVGEESRANFGNNAFPGNSDGSWKINTMTNVLYRSEHPIEAGDAMKCPAWQEFILALGEHCPEDGVDSVMVEGICLSDALLDMLLPALAKIPDISLQDIVVERKQLISLIDFVADHTTLTKLHFMFGPGGRGPTAWEVDQEVATRFAAALKDHSTLQEIILSDFGLGDSSGALPILFEGLKDLNTVRMCHIELSGQGRVIADVLASNPNLSSLNAGCNTLLGGDDMVCIANALGSNTNLRCLGLKNQSREVTDAGRSSLRRAGLDPSSLRSIVNSNHTCIVIYDKMDRIQEEMNRLIERGMSRNDIIKHKIVLALRASDDGVFNVDLLKDVPCQLLPEVLHCVQLGSGKSTLENAFEMMRNFVAPVLSPPRTKLSAKRKHEQV